MDGTRQSEIVQAAVKILSAKQVAGNLLTLKEIIENYHQSVRSSLDVESESAKQSVCVCMCVCTCVCVYIGNIPYSTKTLANQYI